MRSSINVHTFSENASVACLVGHRLTVVPACDKLIFKYVKTRSAKLWPPLHAQPQSDDDAPPQRPRQPSVQLVHAMSGDANERGYTLRAHAAVTVTHERACALQQHHVFELSCRNLASYSYIRVSANAYNDKSGAVALIQKNTIIKLRRGVHVQCVCVCVAWQGGRQRERKRYRMR